MHVHMSVWKILSSEKTMAGQEAQLGKCEPRKHGGLISDHKRPRKASVTPVLGEISGGHWQG